VEEIPDFQAILTRKPKKLRERPRPSPPNIGAGDLAAHVGGDPVHQDQDYPTLDRPLLPSTAAR
jgi:hypothetical protein